MMPAKKTLQSSGSNWDWIYPAYGTARKGSDADILVVMPVKGAKRKKASEIDVALVGIDLPVDLIAVMPEELERSKNQIGTIIYPVLKEGKVLYERAA